MEDYAAGARTDAGATCSFRLRRACPNLKNETLHPTALPAGRRTLKVRIVDAGGNVLEQGPYAVDVKTPSDRGPRNGADATDDAGLTAHFTGTTKVRRTVGYRARVRISGRLLNSAGRPIARRRAARAHARPPLGRALRGPLRGHDRRGRRLPRDRARRRLAPRRSRGARTRRTPASRRAPM